MNNEIKNPLMVLSEVEGKLDAKIAEINKIIKDGGVLSVKIMNELNDIEKECAAQKAIVVFCGLKAEKSPEMAAIKQLTFPIAGHQVETSTDKDTKAIKITGIKRVEKTRQIDRLKFCKFAGLPTDWQWADSALNQSLCLWSAAELNYSKPELKELARTYYLQKEVQKLANGEKPTSMNALCKLLQASIDAFLPNGGYKCNNHDIKYLLMCYTRKGKKALSIKVANDTYLRNLIMDVMHRIVCDKRYTLDYKMVKEAVATDKAEPKTDSPTPAASPEIKPEPELDLDFDNKLFEDLGELDDSWLNESLDLPSISA